MASSSHKQLVGLKTPNAVLAADRRTMIGAFGRAHYVRYDESFATRLVEVAVAVGDDYSGNLRRLATAGGCDTNSVKRLLKRFKGIGDTGANIFLREVQDAWPWVRPHLDERAAVRVSLGDDMRAGLVA
jgi:hypothetical protein